MGKQNHDNPVMPTDEQLETMAHIIDDWSGRTMREIMTDVWDYIEREIGRVRREKLQEED